MANRGLIVDVRINSGESQKGVLRVIDDDVVVEVDSGKVISGKNSTNVVYSITEDPILSQTKVKLTPTLLRTHFYTPEVGRIIEDIFPPSTRGFYGRLQVGKERAVIIIQEIVNDSRLCLIIGNPQTGRIFEVQAIHQYEAETLKLTDDTEITELWDKQFWSDKGEIFKKHILAILDEPSPSWEMISKFIGEEVIPDIQRGKTVGETLAQIVPASFPDQIHDQLMAFLAYVMMDKIEIDDLYDHSSLLYADFMFSILVRGHLRCKIDGIKWPSYLDLILQSVRGQLEQPKRTMEELSGASWRLLLQKIYESFPNWFGNAINSAQKLNESTKFYPRLPVTESQAKRSKKLWKKRLATITYGLEIHGHIDPHAIGLRELVYIGAAYRWPHRHMRFITRLGIVSENPPHLQVMTLPPSSMERVMRALPQCIKMSWSRRVVNLSLYDEGVEKWEIPVDKILASLHEQKSKSKITRRFGNTTSSDLHQISSNEAKVLDLVSSGINLENFERPRYFQFWDLSRKQVASSISKLHSKGILQITYELRDTRLVSLATIIQGDSENVASLAYSFLENTPTSLAMLNENFETGVVLSRIPENIAYNLSSKLNQLGLQQGLAIRCLRPRAYRSFTSTLYQRLLRPDGTWDDDVSAFLSQARSKRRELSESNA